MSTVAPSRHSDTKLPEDTRAFAASLIVTQGETRAAESLKTSDTTLANLACGLCAKPDTVARIDDALRKMMAEGRAA